MLILLADDHELIREGVKLVLNENSSEYKFLEAQDYPQTLNHIKTSEHIDIILLDLSMPGMKRLAGLKQVRKSAPSIPIIVLSVFEGTEDINSALSYGANGYVAKSSAGKALPHAIEQVMQGETCLPDTFVNSSGITTGTQCDYRALPELASAEFLLTARQLDVLQFLVDGYANKEIARKLNIAEPTVKTHLSNIYRVLGISTRTGAVRIALNMGMQ
ncbi:hypothetical protein MNBD_GAMMA11-879 [hydrothermal vent metagenome]|uniref:Two-component transcriptional response regulator, LuxR family n=1 Tax=hydrothermal vent metagenome TaxID=652676 RepID=A0A3B0WV85_9ZZZZ